MDSYFERVENGDIAINIFDNHQTIILRASSVILENESEWFKKQIGLGQCAIDMTEEKADIVLMMMEYMHYGRITSQIEFDSTNHVIEKMIDLIVLCHEYQIRKVFMKIMDKVISIITCDNCDDIYELAQIHGEVLYPIIKKCRSLMYQIADPDELDVKYMTLYYLRKKLAKVIMQAPEVMADNIDHRLKHLSRLSKNKIYVIPISCDANKLYTYIAVADVDLIPKFPYLQEFQWEKEFTKVESDDPKINIYIPFSDSKFLLKCNAHIFFQKIN